MFRNLGSVVLVMALVLGLAGAAAAGVVEITTADGTGADANVFSGGADTNYGTLNNMVIGAYGDPQINWRKGYVRFDLGALDVSTVTGASFEWTYSYNANNAGIPAGGFTFSVYGLNDGHVDESWVEGNGGADNNPVGEITWNNAPANAASNTLTGDATLLGTFLLPAGSPLGTDITFTGANLLSFIQADNNAAVTLIILAPNVDMFGYTIGFAAKEYNLAASAGVNAGNGNVIKPTLTLTTLDDATTPIAEPAGLGLLGLALLGLRKRRN